MFRELFDKVIEMKHGFKAGQRHVTDFDTTKLQNAVFDPKYVESIRIRTIRNIRGYCLPSFCTRGERREVESIAVQALTQLDKYKGMYFSFPFLSKNDELNLERVRFLSSRFLDSGGQLFHSDSHFQLNVDTERPFLPTETSCNFSRDWPDARGIWLSIDKTLGAYVNRKDHVLLSVTEETNDFQKCISKFFAFVQQVRRRMALSFTALYESCVAQRCIESFAMSSFASFKIKSPKMATQL